MKRGSALLIVLGMMAFMVVSAVAFSVFMRQSRLPSSFLRQRVTSSQLVKAGLAGAMREIDQSIGNDPYPGVRNGGNNANPDGNNDRNYWKNRVFMGDNATYNQGDNDEVGFETVSTLTFEGLAYLPPPLVNTVRYWSRRTRTAAWQPLGYDAGRYAYTAVNVSDYFDLNRIRANVMRDSSPGNRISMGYLFENDAHTGDGTVSPAAFEQFVAATTNDAFKTRLVSMADYNLAVDSGEYGNAGFTSPFCRYIKNPPKDGTFYGSGRDDAKRQKFVPDSWYPGSLTNTTAILLTDPDSNPIDGLDTRGGLDPLMKNLNPCFNEIKKHLNLPERAAFVDYLDEDNVPTSLALPTIERSPMLTGLHLVPVNFAPKFVLDKQEVEDLAEVDPVSGDKYKMVHRVWKLDTIGGDAQLLVGGSALFPFKRQSATKFTGAPALTYGVQVFVRMYFSTDAHLDTRSTCDYRPSSGDWSNPASDVRTGVWSFCSDGTLSVPAGGARTENEALLTLSDVKPVKLGSAQFNANNQVYGIKYRMNPKTGAVVGDILPDTDKMDNPLKLRDMNGNVTDMKTVVPNLKDLTVNLLVWVRVLDDLATVDLVPATIADDQTCNRVALPAVTTDLLGEPTRKPLVPVPGPKLGITKDAFKPTGDDPVETTPEQSKGLRIYCNDPRYNWAPEDWYTPGEDATISKDDWLVRVEGQLNGEDYRPHDLFQFVSNQDYLQSMGELQFLPLVRTDYEEIGTSDNPTLVGSFFNSGRYDGKPFAERTKLGQLANNHYMWKTRWAFGPYADWDSPDGSRHDPYAWNILDSNGGMKVSPYADKDLMMGALANTPYDWIIASVNDKMTLSAGRPYCFGPGSSEARISWENLQRLAQNIKSEIGANPDWLSKFRGPSDGNSPWWTDNLFDVDMGDSFHDVDRKYLYSYWKNCFGNEQQLFLIFVRAEPAVMGGSNAGHTPSQLGARAVALVWREPVSTVRTTTNGTAPHRMRILFYHQFE